MLSKVMKSSLVLCAASLLTHTTSAASIPLIDNSFENSGFAGSLGVPGTGWFTFSTTFSQKGILVDPGTFWNMSNADGSNAAYSVQVNENDGGSIYQAVNLDAGVNYRFTVGVGMSATAPKNDGKYAVVIFDNFFPQQAVTNGIVDTRGGFTDVSVDFMPTTTGIYHVGMRNLGYVPGTGADNNQSTVFFDNARLTVIPEPSALAIGVVGLLTIRRRRG